MKYLTFSYDDGTRQDIKLIEIFRKYGMKATFNLNSGSLGHVGRINHFGFDVCFDKVRPDEVKDLYCGFEVAMHGVRHRNFPTLDDEQLAAEVAEDAKALEALCGKKVVGGAYPCGVYDDKIADRLRNIGIMYCRTIKETHNFEFPEDFNLWHPTCHDNDERIFDMADDFIRLDGEKDSVFYIWGHSYELDKNDRDRWYNIEKLCDKLAGRNDIVYASNADCMKGFINK